MLVSGGFDGDLKHEAKPFRIVRVETSNTDANGADNAEKEPSQEPSPESEEPSECKNVEAEPLVGGEEDCGKGVARKMTGKIGASVFRGIIVKVSYSCLTSPRPLFKPFSLLLLPLNISIRNLLFPQYKDDDMNEDCDPSGRWVFFVPQISLPLFSCALSQNQLYSVFTRSLPTDQRSRCQPRKQTWHASSLRSRPTS